MRRSLWFSAPATDAGRAIPARPREPPHRQSPWRRRARRRSALATDAGRAIPARACGGERLADRFGFLLRRQMRGERSQRERASPLIANRLGGGERGGGLLWRQMRGERSQRVRASPLIANRLGGGERGGGLLWRQMRGERSQRVRASPLIAARASFLQRSGYQVDRLNGTHAVKLQEERYRCSSGSTNIDKMKGLPN